MSQLSVNRLLTDKKIGRKCGPPCEVMDLWIKQKKLNFELEFRKKSKKKKKIHGRNRKRTLSVVRREWGKKEKKFRSIMDILIRLSRRFRQLWLFFLAGFLAAHSKTQLGQKI